ncbi:alpha-1-acid glycoprotein 1 [Perognathus longimembris pacificus]|uniref:alpha-1-acid glycoprotein 1 n=1 Tax=Perognathus longimembris pacificus TaxID=214514 RepID=UPI00201890A7|nr:alpha-1-acid glycoprotein 1 [Perognathus longimembris pacificus]
MALLGALAVLSLLPLLEAHNLTLTNLTAIPLTNATLEWLSGRWFFLGSAFRNPAYKQAAEEIQAAFFDFVPNLAEDTILVRDYQTMEDKCIHNSTNLRVQRENGTLSKFEGGVEHLAVLLLPKNSRSFMLGFSLEDAQNLGLSFYGDKPHITPGQLEEFQDAATVLGLLKTEMTYVDWKKDQCGPLQQQQGQDKEEVEP